jgi:hypothetical protein
MHPYRPDRGPEPMSGSSDMELTRDEDWQRTVFNRRFNESKVTLSGVNTTRMECFVLHAPVLSRYGRVHCNSESPYDLCAPNTGCLTPENDRFEGDPLDFPGYSARITL